jgi:Leucine-rich repeat (LRR) protein
MKKLLLLALLLTVLTSKAQITYIPDDNFENYLISQGIDDVLDDYVLTSKISSIQSLSLTDTNISDLTGIQGFINLTDIYCTGNNFSSLDFSNNLALKNINCQFNSLLTNLNVTKNTALKRLNCNSNNLTSLDVTKNIALTDLYCYENKLTSLVVTNNTFLSYLNFSNNSLTSLDVTKNTLLDYLDCNFNQLTTLDVSKNTVLTYLSFSFNQLTTLDVTKNPSLFSLYTYHNQLISLDVTKNIALKTLSCSFNQLTSLDVSSNLVLQGLYCSNNQLLTNLNLRNGNNINLKTNNSNFTSNPNLTCIQVDDATYSNANWASLKDAGASYSSTSCPTLGVADVVFGKLEVFPNPTTGIININNVTLDQATAYDAEGREVKTALFAKTTNNSIDLVGLSKGVYFLYLQSQGATAVKKVVLE